MTAADDPGASRRGILRAAMALPAIGLLGATPPSGGASPHMHGSPSEPSSAPRQPGQTIFTEHELQTVRILCDLVIPADENSPGANSVGVPEFIDSWLAFVGGSAVSEIRGGLIWLDAESQRTHGENFATAPVPRQLAMLDRIAWIDKVTPNDHEGALFFGELRKLIVGGFFSTEVGTKDLNYQGNVPLAEWLGCPNEALTHLGVSPRGTVAKDPGAT